MGQPDNFSIQWNNTQLTAELNKVKDEIFSFLKENGTISEALSEELKQKVFIVIAQKGMFGSLIDKFFRFEDPTKSNMIRYYYKVARF